MPDFKEISRSCIENFKDSLDTERERYLQTLYVAISESNKVYCSTTPHILNRADKCILIHSRKALAQTNWYTWYKLDYINEEGLVTEGIIEEGFRIYSDWIGSWSNMMIYLMYEDLEIYSCETPFADKMQTMWNYFLRVKEMLSNASIDLIAEMIEKDKRILELKDNIANLKFDNYILERQLKQHKWLVREIKDSIRET